MNNWMVTRVVITYPTGKTETRYSVLDDLSYPLFELQTRTPGFSEPSIIKRDLTQEAAVQLKIDLLKGQLK